MEFFLFSFLPPLFSSLSLLSLEDIHFSSGNAPSFLALSGSFLREDGQEDALSKKLPLPLLSSVLTKTNLPPRCEPTPLPTRTQQPPRNCGKKEKRKITTYLRCASGDTVPARANENFPFLILRYRSRKIVTLDVQEESRKIGKNQFRSAVVASLPVVVENFIRFRLLSGFITRSSSNKDLNVIRNLHNI